MATKLTADSFLSVVKKSGLIEAEQWHRLLRELKRDGVDLQNANAIADALVARSALTRWQADKLLQGKHKGFFLGKYRLLSLLGKGGMSSVYLAEHVLMRRQCAIKVLPSRRVKDSSYLARFHREAQAVAALDHSNIVRAYDVDSEVNRDTEIHFLVMEYVDGRSLLDIVTQEWPLSFVQAAEFIRQAAEGLAHAHKAGMVHRDVKPGNLLVDSRGVVKLLDLGLARFFHEKEEKSLTMTHDEKVLGTADYLAPEQALDSHNVDARADIYGLGCTFYFLLAGHAPFTEGTLAQRLMSHQTKQPPPVEQDRPDVPESLVAVIDKMMAKKRRDRYQTADEVAGTLEDWLIENGGDEWHRRRSKSVFSGSDSSSDTATSDSSVDESASPPALPAARTPSEETSSAPAVQEPTGEPSVPPAAADEDNDELATFLSNLETATASSAEAASSAPTRFPQDQESGVTERPENASSPEAPVESAPSGPPVASESEPDAESATLPTESRAPSPREPAPSQPPVAQPVHPKSPGASEKSPKAVPVAVPVGPPPSEASGAESPVAAPSLASDNADLSSIPAITSSYSASRSKPKRGSTRSPVAGLTGELRSLGQQVTRKPAAKVALLSAAAMLTVAVGMFLIKPLLTGSSNGTEKTSIEQGKTDTGAETIKTDTHTNTAGPPLPREVTVGPGGDFKSIGEALARVKAAFDPLSRKDRQIIHIAPGTYPERLVIDNSKFSWPKGIQLLAQGDEPVILAPTGSEPVLSLKGVEKLTVEGLHIRAEGKPVAVSLSGYLAGVTLKGVTISGFEETGLLGRGPTGFSGNENQLALDDLTIEGGNPKAIGMRFQSDGQAPSQIRIESVQLRGPLATGIAFDGDVRYVSIRQTIISEVGTGIRFEGADPELREIVLQNNSFYKLDRGIVFSNLPSRLGGDLQIVRNLFAEIQGPETLVEHGYQKAQFLERMAERGLAENWSSRPAPLEAAPGEVDIFVVNGKQGQTFQFRSTNPADPGFLLPDPKAPHASIGATRPQ